MHEAFYYWERLDVPEESPPRSIGSRDLFELPPACSSALKTKKARERGAEGWMGDCRLIWAYRLRPIAWVPAVTVHCASSVLYIPSMIYSTCSTIPFFFLQSALRVHDTYMYIYNCAVDQLNSERALGRVHPGRVHVPTRSDHVSTCTYIYVHVANSFVMPPSITLSQYTAGRVTAVVQALTLLCDLRVLAIFWNWDRIWPQRVGMYLFYITATHFANHHWRTSSSYSSSLDHYHLIIYPLAILGIREFPTTNSECQLLTNGCALLP